MKPRALLVEHDAAVRATLAMALDTLGFTVDAMASGDLALDAVADQGIAIAIIEARVPGVLSGAETLESLKLQLPSLPMIVLCEPDRPQDLLDAFHAGAVDVLLKPFELDELRTALGRALVGRGEAVSLDFHARVELAKTTLVAGALDVAEAHLCSALGLDPLDAEVLNLLGVVCELRSDGARATRAYRAAYACDANYGRARRNLERILDQFTYIGPSPETRGDPLEGTRLRVAVPLIDPVRDLPLVRLARRVGGPTAGVALGIFLDPPSEEAGNARVAAVRAGFVRSAGRFDAGSIPCAMSYVLARDPASGVRALTDGQAAHLVLIGAWMPEYLRGAMGKLPLAIARDTELPQADAVACILDGERAPEALGLAAHLASSLRAPLLLPAALVEGEGVASLPARVLYERTGLVAPPWIDGDVHVPVRLRTADDVAILVGDSPEAFLRTPARSD